MLMYTWMVWVEHAPERYDQAVRIMTAGRIDTIKELIASTIMPNQKVLDIGCGTGSLGVLCAKRGATVTGIDASQSMLQQARQNIARAELGERFQVRKGSATRVGTYFADNELDAIISTMVVGEFPRMYVDYIFRECYRILRPGGQLLIADEVWPEHPVWRQLYKIMMALLWIPQFVLLRRAFFPAKDLRDPIEAAGFTVESVRRWAFSSFQLVIARKPQ